MSDVCFYMLSSFTLSNVMTGRQSGAQNSVLRNRNYFIMVPVSKVNGPVPAPDLDLKKHSFIRIL